MVRHLIEDDVVKRPSFFRGHYSYGRDLKHQLRERSLARHRPSLGAPEVAAKDRKIGRASVVIVNLHFDVRLPVAVTTHREPRRSPPRNVVGAVCNDEIPRNRFAPHRTRTKLFSVKHAHQRARAVHPETRVVFSHRHQRKVRRALGETAARSNFMRQSELVDLRLLRRHPAQLLLDCRGFKRLRHRRPSRRRRVETRRRR